MLVEVTVDSLNREDEVEEWEEVDFMVDSGAGTTVIAETDVKAVVASEPDPTRHYILADGSTVPDGCHKAFNAYTEDSLLTNVSAPVTSVEQPRLSVSQVVAGGSEVIFFPKSSYISSPGGTRITLELRRNTYHLKMWVPRNQSQLF